VVILKDEKIDGFHIRYRYLLSGNVFSVRKAEATSDYINASAPSHKPTLAFAKNPLRLDANKVVIRWKIILYSKL